MATKPANPPTTTTTTAAPAPTPAFNRFSVASSTDSDAHLAQSAPQPVDQLVVAEVHTEPVTASQVKTQIEEVVREAEKGEAICPTNHDPLFLLFLAKYTDLTLLPFFDKH